MASTGARVGEDGGTLRRQKGRRKVEPSSFSGGSANHQLTSLEAKLEKQQSDLKAGQRHSPHPAQSVCVLRDRSVGWGPGRQEPAKPTCRPHAVP